jgi:hypothetical protein
MEAASAPPANPPARDQSGPRLFVCAVRNQSGIQERDRAEPFSQRGMGGRG